MFSQERHSEKQPFLGQKSSVVSFDNHHDHHHHSIDDDSTTSRSSIMDAESFLDSYEEMLHHQKEEVSSTMRHLEPLLEILESKRTFFQTSAANTEDDDDNTVVAPLAREFTYLELRQALNQVAQDPALRFVASDLQWKSVLEVLSQTCEGDNNEEDEEEERISWAEIVMCYRVCIVSMQTLDQTPHPGELRSRVRQRSMRMIEAFRPQKSRNMNAAQPRPQATTSDKKATLNLMQWLGTIVVGGSLILAVIVYLSTLAGTTGNLRTAFPKLDVSVFASPDDSFLIPGPIVSAHAPDALKIPGPVVSPFPTDAQTIQEHPSASPIEYKPLPSSVQESSTEERAMPVKMHRALVPPSLAAVSDVPNEKMSIAAPSSKRIMAASFRRGILKKGLAVIAVAGGTAAAALVAPLAPSAMASLGPTIMSVFPIGATVVLSTLLAHGIRDFFVAKRAAADPKKR